MKRFFILAVAVLAVALVSCKKKCYVCMLEQINGPNAPIYPNQTINIDTLETCNGRWVRENNVPAGETYPQSWRCKEIQ